MEKKGATTGTTCLAVMANRAEPAAQRLKKSRNQAAEFIFAETAREFSGMSLLDKIITKAIQFRTPTDCRQTHRIILWERFKTLVRVIQHTDKRSLNGF